MTDAERFEAEFHAAGCCECGRSDLPMEHDGFSSRLLCCACYAARIDKIDLYFKGKVAGRKEAKEEMRPEARSWAIMWFFLGWLTCATGNLILWLIKSYPGR